MFEFASMKIQYQMFLLECAKYWEDLMQIEEFIIRTVIHKASNQTADILFIQ